MFSFTETTMLWSHAETPETTSSQHCRESGLRAEDTHTWSHTHRLNFDWSLLDLWKPAHTQVLKFEAEPTPLRHFAASETKRSLDWTWMCFEENWNLRCETTSALCTIIKPQDGTDNLVTMLLLYWWIRKSLSPYSRSVRADYTSGENYVNIFYFPYTFYYSVVLY